MQTKYELNSAIQGEYMHSALIAMVLCYLDLVMEMVNQETKLNIDNWTHCIELSIIYWKKNTCL